MAESTFSIKEKKFRLDKAEDCTDVLGLLTASKAFERVEFNGNTISSPAAKALAEAVATQEQLKVISPSSTCPAFSLPPSLSLCLIFPPGNRYFGYFHRKVGRDRSGDVSFSRRAREAFLVRLALPSSFVDLS